MNTPWHVIKLLEADNSRLYKEAIIKLEADANNFDFFDGVRLALDKMVTFGVKQIPTKLTSTGKEPGLTWGVFSLAITGLVSREVTGNAARDLVVRLMDVATAEQWNFWYRRILIKDLRCGVSEKTVNNVVSYDFPQVAVPVFSVQLAQDGAKHEKKMKGKKQIEAKYDGSRVITIVHPNGKVDQFSRNGKEVLNFPHIKNQFRNVAKHLPEPMVFDGEIMSASFQDLMTQLRRKENVDTTDSLLFLFDMMPLTDFENGFSAIPQHQRSENLKNWYGNNTFLELMGVRVTHTEIVDLDTEEGQEQFKKLNRLALDNGLEGIMIKDVNAPYECKRSSSWLKQKPVISVDLTIIGIEEGTGRNEGRLGAFVCKGIDQDREICANVGSGFSDKQREEFFTEEVIDYVVEVFADAVTQNQDGTFSLRFPRYHRFRGFEPGEKI